MISHYINETKSDFIIYNEKVFMSWEISANIDYKYEYMQCNGS